MLLQNLQADKEPETGKLKIFIGMAAGVGKTYAMLVEGNEQSAAGRSVLCGYIEPHNRPDTANQVKQLEQLPTRSVDYNGMLLKEFDLEAALARKPDLLLLDELAHTNAPGSRHPQRWMDALELLDNGIDVYTTINIQHLESLKDTVETITGSPMQETVPDRVIERANQIELIDIPPEELIERINAGKIYPQERISPALNGFFKLPNLLALRELVLRKLADHVDKRVLNFRKLQDSAQNWHVKERVLVAITENKFASRLVRAALRVAESRRAELVVVSVFSPRNLTTSTRQSNYLVEALKVAERSGAKTIQRHGLDIVSELLEVAQDENVNLIVVGKPLRSRLKDLLFGSVADNLMRRSGNIDLQLIASNELEGPSIRHKLRTKEASFYGLLWSTAVVSATTFFCAGVYPFIAEANLNMLYMLSVVLVATFFGAREAIWAAMLSVAAFDFFFVPPRFTFAVADVEYLITFMVMLVSSLLVSSLTLKLRNQVKEIGERQQRIEKLYSLGNSFIKAGSRQEIARLTRDFLQQNLKVDACVFCLEGDELLLMADSNEQTELKDHELPVARLAVSKLIPCGAGTDILPGASGLYYPILIDHTAIGALGLFTTELPLNSGDETTLQLVSQSTGEALQRLDLEEQNKNILLAAENERTRNILLSSISHDLRTPLTGLKGCVSALTNPELDPIDRSDLVETIRLEVERLELFVRNILDLVRLETHDFRLNFDWIYPSEILGAAIEEIKQRLGARAVNLKINGEERLISADPLLLKQLLVNILENACKYSPVDSVIDILIDTNGTPQTMRIRDHGPGIPVGFERKIFEKAFRLSSVAEPTAGFGLGLAISQEIAHLHGGDITAQNWEDGAEFTISLNSPINQEDFML